MQIQSLSVNKFTKDNNCFFQFHSNHFVVEDEKHRNLCEKHRNLCSKDRLKMDHTDFLGLPCSHYAKEHKHSSVKKSAWRIGMHTWDIFIILLWFQLLIIFNCLFFPFNKSTWTKMFFLLLMEVNWSHSA